ncbi:MAG: hypothetical protein OXF76_10210 [Caldilineaceae bacterium]|nr:hypothetical protein [Caldilineaceae bacterium]
MGMIETVWEYLLDWTIRLLPRAGALIMRLLAEKVEEMLWPKIEKRIEEIGENLPAPAPIHGITGGVCTTPGLYYVQANPAINRTFESGDIFPGGEFWHGLGKEERFTWIYVPPGEFLPKVGLPSAL